MVNHSLVKLVLFLAAGVIHMNTGKLNLNEIRGYGRGKPLLLFVFSMGALGLAGVPLWSGYVGKTLIHESIVEHIHQLHLPTHTGAISELLHSGLFDLETEVVLFQSVEWIFLISGALTVAYMLKLFVALFLTEPTRPPHSRRSYVSVPSSVILCLSALLPLLLGLFPNRLMDPIGALGAPFMNGHPPSHPVDYFAWANLKGAMLTLALGAAFYFIIVYVRLMREDASGRRRYVDLWPRWMDLERLLYRPILTGLLPFLGALLARVVDVLCDGPVSMLLGRADRKRFVVQPKDEYFGVYAKGDAAASPSFRAFLPSSLAYSLLAFALGLLFVLIYLLV